MSGARASQEAHGSQASAAAPEDAPSLSAARTVVAALVAAGVREAVLSPGSRSAPLAYALAEAEDRGALRLRVVLDERSAGFTALGLARAHLQAGGGEPVSPVVVVTTSGSAVANLHPAVLEADAAGVPLLIVSADRPHELVGTGANQTTEQAGLFATAPRLVIDIPADLAGHRPAGSAGALALGGQVRRAVLAASGALSRDPGPAHLNLRLRPPLAPSPSQAPVPEAVALPDAPAAGAPRPGGRPGVSPQPDAFGGVGVSDAGGPAQPAPAAATADQPVAGQDPRSGPAQCGLVVVGDCPDPATGRLGRALAEHLAWPLLAEPTSGARGGAMALTRYAELLGTPEGARLVASTERVVVLGHPSLTRSVSALLARTDLRVDVVADRARYTDVAGTAHVLPAPAGHGGCAGGEPGEVLLARALGAVPADPGWAPMWHRALECLEPAAPRRPDGARPGLSADAAVQAVWEAALKACAGPDRGAAGGPAGDTTEDTAGGAAGGGAPAVLMLGSSMTVRRLDRLAAPAAAGLPVPAAVANRGLAGIDGTLATAAGVALGVGAPVRAVVGDLTFLHDAMSLGRGLHETEPDLQVIVLDDAGGAIFSTLEYARVPGAARFDRLFTTPQTPRIGALAQALGATVHSPGDLEGLRRVLAAPVRGLSVVHVVLHPCEPR
ncbi:MAG: 2-succinyl-5-enolpyruvyl-6-hydroxy-3-cyclohexene-1-carboxylic-acid synthase [Actinomyces sp.]|uniref:2-succinyl-5-enolpyruvyl-6-hydroxy-3- cyclohexene-1-carboxylic-acid synthase n=1 Tax=Actinomyces sp. TaxID=29317 RepID=UPI0026DC69D6|nr:2-succinyl-5-enolpyruvyl-6-hydroxy-3-cyclohexene-1-carboxylic-acid synthase [Actinomyces sp.]MDO4242164.1 2-succinyl-5-enolpyruvyl-6-hydroxy-3-cyclohexene-1-carboxylic-acid synthase [Actinomyces sp.]